MAAVSYLHMHMLVARHRQPGWVAPLTPLSVDGEFLMAGIQALHRSHGLRPDFERLSTPLPTR